MLLIGKIEDSLFFFVVSHSTRTVRISGAALQGFVKKIFFSKLPEGRVNKRKKCINEEKWMARIFKIELCV